MKQVILIGSKQTQGKNDVVALGQAVQKQLTGPVKLWTCFWEDLVFDITMDRQQVTDAVSQLDLAQADLVLSVGWYKTVRQSFYRDIAFTLALYLKSRGVGFWNTEMVQQRSTTKLSCMMQLALAGIAVPATRFSLSADMILATTTKFPVVVKAIAASRGRHNYLVKDQAELKQRLVSPRPVLIQEFIANDADLRVICYGGEPALVVKRQRASQDTHLNNTSQGGNATLLPLAEVSPEILQQSRQICAIMKREMAGVDLLVAPGGTNRVVCLEVNAIPQLTSGSFVPQKAQALTAALQQFLKGR